MTGVGRTLPMIGLTQAERKYCSEDRGTDGRYILTYVHLEERCCEVLASICVARCGIQ
jgi:hypothetical protein